MMLLGVSVASALIIGSIGYASGTSALRDAEFDRLVEVRESRSQAVVSLIEDMRNVAATYSRSLVVSDAARDFSAAYRQLAGAQRPPEQSAALDEYYRKVFAENLEKGTGQPVDAELFDPKNAAARYLQGWYTVPAAGDFTVSLDNSDAGDNSAWSAVSARECWRCRCRRGSPTAS